MDVGRVGLGARGLIGTEERAWEEASAQVGSRHREGGHWDWGWVGVSLETQLTYVPGALHTPVLSKAPDFLNIYSLGLGYNKIAHFISWALQLSLSSF